MADEHVPNGVAGGLVGSTQLAPTPGESGLEPVLTLAPIYEGLCNGIAVVIDPFYDFTLLKGCSG